MAASSRLYCFTSISLQNVWRLHNVGLLILCSLLKSGFFAAAATSPSLSHNYKDALTKSLLFLEVQRSGKLPLNQWVTYTHTQLSTHHYSGQVDLSGGYYDAGDNVKFGFPMALGAIENTAGFQSAGELSNVRQAIRWGTDYLVKASTVPKRLWVQVREAEADHQCSERPESMKTPRTSVQINASNPGTEVAAETAAGALAAASIVFQCGRCLLPASAQRASMVFCFADKYRASNTGECPFYCTYSGYKDELLWLYCRGYLSHGHDKCRSGTLESFKGVRVAMR
ncbi:hypothetical protein L7F22_032711 [Adiantum nelumboides]|nr:hypothetical protein [Adiantum nelumboides]